MQGHRIGGRKMVDNTLICLESRIQRDGSIYGRYEVGSFTRGEGVTIATVLRRALLSELPGIAMTGVKIEGAKHEYCTMRGVRDSVLDITCNLKEVVLAGRLVSSQTVLGHLNLQGPMIVRGRDIKLPPGLRCVNPEQYIATLTHDGILRMKIVISTGKNYLLHTSERNKKLNSCGFLPIDANFMPIKKVNFLLSPDQRWTVLQEQLLLEIWSNGSIDHLAAIRLAARSVTRLFAPFEKIQLKKDPIFLELPPFEKMQLKKDPSQLDLQFPRDSEKSREILFDSSEVIDLINAGNFELSVKTNTYLRRNNIQTIGQLVSMSSDLRRMIPKNISLEIEAHLSQLIERTMRRNFARVDQ